jgi:hypothetical protein
VFKWLPIFLLPWESNCLYSLDSSGNLCGGDSQTRLERIAGDIVLWKWGFVLPPNQGQLFSVTIRSFQTTFYESS